MSFMSRPSCRITIGDTYYELIDSYERVKEIVDKTADNEHAMLVVTRWDNRKEMSIRVKDISTVQQMGY